MTTEPATKPLHGKCRLGWNAGLGSNLTRPGDAGTGDAFLLVVTPGNIKGMAEETLNTISFQLNQYLSYKPHSSFTPTWMSVDFMCP